MGAVRASVLVAALLLAAPLHGCGGGDPDEGQEELAADQVLRLGVVWEGEYSPAELLYDSHGVWTTSSWNIFDPLVKVDEQLRPVPAMAERWEVSPDGLTVTFHLRRDGRWTNGDPLTAHDYVFGMRHNFFPSDGPEPTLTNIVGVSAYTLCDVRERRDCMSLWDDVGVEARDDHTLEIRLERPDPYFVGNIGGADCTCYVAFHQETVERYGDEWVEPEHIVTSGPFTIAGRDENSFTLVKNETWRDADSVALERVEIRYFRDEQAAARALERGEIDVSQGTDVDPALVSAYPLLNTRWIALRPEDIPDPRQRRAMALVVDRRALAGSDLGRPATSATTEKAPGFERIATDFLQQEPQLEEARALLAAAEDPRPQVTLWVPDAPQARAIGAQVQEAWGLLGVETSIKSVPPDQHFDLATEGKLDGAYLAGWTYALPDPGELLELFHCEHPYNPWTSFCDPAYDRVVDRARDEADEGARLDLYAEAEAFLTGPDGAMPLVPYVWRDNALAERPSVRKTYGLNALGQVDLTKVRVAAD